MRTNKKIAVITGLVLVFGVTTSLIAYEVESHQSGLSSLYPYPTDAGFTAVPLSQCGYDNNKKVGVMVFLGNSNAGMKPFIACRGKIIVNDFTEVKIPHSNSDLTTFRAPGSVSGWGINDKTLVCSGDIQTCYFEYR